MRRPRRGFVIALAVVLALTAAGVGAAAYFGLIFTSPTVRDAEEVSVPAETVAERLDIPWGIAFLPDGSALVTERGSARLLRVTADGTVTEVQRIPGVVPRGEGGLLGVAVSPDYASDGLVYVYYTAERDNRIARFTLGATPEPIFTGIPKASNHDGGRIAFGPDGMLYVGTGDAGERDTAQDLASLGGKILRLTPAGEPAPGNPFASSPVYSYGHRNVQGLAWDSSGRMFASEFGQSRYDELNEIRPGGNYGWPTVEGMSRRSGFVNPIATWSTSDASPSGLAVVGDRAYLACLRGRKIASIGLDGSSPQALLSDEYGRLRAVAPAPDGSLWILTSNRDGRGRTIETDDRILRITV